jgi:hypothetical protein
MTTRQALPSDHEVNLIFMKLPSRIRRSLNDLAAAGGCSTLEIVQRFQEGAGHAGFPEPPIAVSVAQKTIAASPPKHPAPPLKPRRRPAKRKGE